MREPTCLSLSLLAIIDITSIETSVAYRSRGSIVLRAYGEVGIDAREIILLRYAPDREKRINFRRTFFLLSLFTNFARIVLPIGGIDLDATLLREFSYRSSRKSTREKKYKRRGKAINENRCIHGMLLIWEYFRYGRAHREVYYRFKKKRRKTVEMDHSLCRIRISEVAIATI